MNTLNSLGMSARALPRRAFLSQSGLLLSGAAVALLSGRDALAAKSGEGAESDLRILNTALGTVA